MLDLSQSKREDCMRSRRGVVHFGRRNSSVLITHVHQSDNIIVTLYRAVGQVLNIDTVGLAFADFEIGRWCSSRDEQIPYVFVVHLKVGDVNIVRYTGVLFLVDALEETFTRSRYQSWMILCAHHSV